MNFMLSVNARLAFVLTVTVVAACKPQAGSEVKTLDNLAAGTKIRQNVCSGSPKSWDKKRLETINMNINIDNKALKTRLGDEVFLAMSALPVVYVDALSTLQVKVLVTPKSNELCSLNGQVADAKGAFITACVLTIPLGGMPEHQDMEGLTIVLAPDAGVVRHALIRTVGQVFSQVLAGRYYAKSLDEKVTFNPERFLQLQIKLGAAFLEDVANSKLFSVDNLEPFLGPDADKIARQSVAAFIAGKTRNPFGAFKTSPAKLAQFLTFVTADSFDSYYCQADDVSVTAYDPKLEKRAKAGDMDAFKTLQNTRLVFKNFFPSSYARFSTINAYMERLAGDIAQLKPKKSSSAKSQGMGLTSTASESSEGFGLAGSGYSASDRRYNEQRMAEYRTAMDSPPTSWERVRHPFEDSEGRKMRIMNEYLEDRQRAVNYARLDTAAKEGLPKPQLINDEGASSTTWAATKGAVQGLGTGAVNIKNGVVKTVDDVATGVSGLASTAYNDGIGAAASKISDAANHKYQTTMDAAEKIGTAYSEGDIDFGRAAFELTGAAASGLPIIGNAADTLRNGVAVISETDAYGQQLSYDDLTKISENQGVVAGAAIFEAAAAKGTELAGKGVSQLAQRGLQAGGKTATNVATYTADALNDAAAAGRLSGLGEVAANSATRTALTLEKTTFGMSHATQHVLGEVVDQSLNFGIVTPTYEAGKVANAHAASGHSGEAVHGVGAESGHEVDYATEPATQSTFVGGKPEDPFVEQSMAEPAADPVVTDMP